MSSGHDVFYSNKVEILYNRLKTALFDPSISPFSKRIIIVPSPAVKSWLMLRLADDPEVGIAMGIEVAYLDQTISKLCRFENILSTAELTLVIETEIRQIIDLESDSIWQPLFNYLKINEKQQSRKSERRLIALSQKLAGLFTEYGIYGSALVEQWREKKSSNWQIELWKRLYADRFNYPSKLLAQIDINEIELKRETRLFLFSISFMPRIYHDFLNALSEILPVSCYQLSPCQLFWSDILSDRESKWLQEYWRKRGVTKAQQDDLELFLRDRNALLANFGRLGREMSQMIEESSAITDECYALPGSIRDQKIYEEVLTEEMTFFGKQDFSALDIIQSDMGLLRCPKKSEQVVLTRDRSIQVHSASNKMRECQVVYDMVMGLIEKHYQDKDPICPEDIIVMSPDIMDYQALIKSVFGSEESQLDYHVLDLHMPAQNELIQAFMHLLELPKTRWDALSLLQLFEYRCFQKKQAFKVEDLQQLSKWIVDLGILWGFNNQHRNEILNDEYGEGLFDGSSYGSWENGFSRLLDQAVEEGTSVSSTKLEFAGQWIALIRSLKEDLKPITNNTKKNIKEWTVYLIELAEKYLGFDEKEESHQPFFEQLSHLGRADKVVPGNRFGFLTIYSLLKDAFCRERISFRETHLHAVRFCSMLPMRAIPAKVIILMGMHEGVFPKQEQQDSLNLLKIHSGADYCPSTTDYDRYLFLEALLSARQYFIVTYQNTSSESGKEQPPSLLVTEILSYLDQACTIDGQTPSSAIIQHHSFHSYDKRYFDSNAQFKSYSLAQYKAAISFYKIDKKPLHQFVKDFSIVKPALETEEIVIDLKQLTALAKNPIKAFLSSSLGIFLRDDENPVTEEGLNVSPLDASIIKREAVYKSIEETLQQAELVGKLPPGVFKEVAVAKIYEDYNDLKRNFQELNVIPEQVFTIEFSEHCQKPVKIDNNWILPALQVAYKEGIKVKITGKLPEVCQQGLISHSKKDPNELPKIWPEFLVYQSLVEQYQLDLGTDLLLMKSGVKKQIAADHPIEVLRQYIDYYFLSMQNISPLQPTWTPKLLKGSQEDLRKVVLQSTDAKWSYDEAVLWLSRQGKDFDLESMYAWQQHADRLFSEPMQKWMV